MVKKSYHYLVILGPAKLIEYFILEMSMFFRRIFQNSYSQWGEDLIIDNLLGRKKKGVYIDIGAYDPTRFSNTKRFYLRGWRGINIEPDPIRIKKFYKERSKDINLNIGIANKNSVLNFFIFDPQTLSTFSEARAKDYQNQGYNLTSTIKIKVRKLGYVLEKHRVNSVDFFNIDTEGSDYEVLKSNNWNKFRPMIVCIEASGSTGNNLEKLLSGLGYKKVYKTKTNLIFQHS